MTATVKKYGQRTTLEVAYILILAFLKSGRGAAARGVTAKPTGSGFDSHSRK